MSEQPTIVPTIIKKAPITSLFPPGPVLGRLVRGCERALRKSFEERPMRQGVTAAEKKRRADMAINIARVLRGECKWSVDKVIDHLPEYLLKELDGIDWKPDSRTIWAPG